MEDWGHMDGFDGGAAIAEEGRQLSATTKRKAKERPGFLAGLTTAHRATSYLDEHGTLSGHRQPFERLSRPWLLADNDKRRRYGRGLSVRGKVPLASC